MKSDLYTMCTGIYVIAKILENDIYMSRDNMGLVAEHAQLARIKLNMVSPDYTGVIKHVRMIRELLDEVEHDMIGRQL